MTKKRVVVTGIGVVSCFGNDADLFYEKLLQGTSGVSEITHFNTDEHSTKIAASIKDFDAGDYMDKKNARRVDKCISYAVVAGKKALESAKMDLAPLNKSRCGVIIGSGMGGMNMFCEGVETLLEKGVKRVSPFFVPYILTNMPGAMLAMDTGFMGPNYSISTACATGNNSIIAAANHIRAGDADVMLCGGTESPIIEMGIAGFSACKALSQRNDEPSRASRPWDIARDGFVMGEGAGVLVLETLEHAQARGASILAEYLGGGVSCDAHHITEPGADGQMLCIQNALKDAGVSPDDINYINAHGTSTPVGDLVEIGSLKKVIPDPSKVKLNSTKSMIGHALGAAGALEAVVVIQAIVQGKIHPTANLENPEPDLGFDIPTKAEDVKINVAISNSFGFGGHNATIVFAPFKKS
jgi:3-oxoacyl-[acyl-carrier-protein] synthase II